MAQIIKHRRGSLESLSAVTSSLQKGELVIASGSSNLTVTNGSSLVFAVPADGVVQATNRFLIGDAVPNNFAGSTYNGMVKGVPYYASGSSTLYLLGTDTNEAINLVGNIQPFSTSVDSRLDVIETSLGGGGGIGTRVANLEAVSQSLQNFSSSQEAKDVIISAYTASMNTFTSSQEAKDVIISAYTASMNTFTSSQEGKDVIISAYTASMNSFSASIYAFTSSQEAKDSTLQTYTSSLNSTIARIQESTASLNAYTASNDTTNTAQNARLTQLEESSASLNTYTSSLRTALTASGTDVTFSNNVTVQGNLTVAGTTTAINSTTVQLGDNIIELNGTGVANGGLLVKDPTSPNTVSGSLLWDSTNDYWKGGAVGAESKFLRAGGDNVVTESVQVLIDQTQGFSTYSSSVSSSLSSLSTTLEAGNIWQLTGSAYNTINNLEITGGVAVSGTINADNTTVGIPTSNAWQTNLNGSYFNNFTSETNVSEILRFVAGLLSQSAPDASPNTRTFNSVTANIANNATGTALTGRIPQTSTNSTITYLASKGFATAGSTIFAGIGTIYTSTALGYNYTSVAAGSTVATSSADAQLFGLGSLSSGNPSSFTVSGSFTFRFADNSSKTATATSQSVLAITQTGAGTTSGVSLAKINTVNPAVIPPGYQDGKFASTLSQTIFNNGATAVSASGYYHISSSIRINSGSSAYSTAITQNGSELFYAPLTTIATNVPAQTVTTSSVALAYVSAASRSLSGAPYLTGSTYTVSSSLNNVFAPLFLNGTNSQLSLSGTGVATTSGNNALATSNGTISNANVVYDSTGTTVRNTATIPFETDIIKLNGLYTFGGTANISNIGQSTISPTTFTVSAVGYDYGGAADTYTNTLSYHVAGTFGQNAASGAMAYFTRAQGADASTALVESFLGESYRIQLADNVLAFNGTAWTTTFALNQLSATDLQVKPGYLVKPGGTNGYWIPNPSSASDYKYYIRKFTTSGTKTSMTLNMGKTLVNWGATTDNSVAAGILFESSKNTIYTPARIFDPSNLTDNFTATKTANTDGQNPFGTNFALYGNTGGSLATTTYTIPLRNGDGMTLNATYTNIYVIVRYKGDPSPVTSITTTFS